MYVLLAALLLSSASLRIRRVWTSEDQRAYVGGQAYLTSMYVCEVISHRHSSHVSS